MSNTNWVKKNKHKLFPNDIQKTFKVVTQIHPRFGMAADMKTLVSIQSKMKTMELKEIAQFADAVTVCCYELIGETTDIPDAINDDNTNATSLGNIAYIASYHSKKEIRDKFTKFVESIKATIL